jgi:hypothetical protein
MFSLLTILARNATVMLRESYRLEGLNFGKLTEIRFINTASAVIKRISCLYAVFGGKLSDTYSTQIFYACAREEI